jgi:hypothetical protein
MTDGVHYIAGHRVPPNTLFPQLGPTGEGDIVYPPGTTAADFKPGDRPLYWQRGAYYVTYQLDRPACAFRCHYPGGSVPCNEETAKRYIEWIERVVL